MKTPKTFEEGAARLEEILDKISDEATPLDEAVKLYAEAAEMMTFCNAALGQAKLKIEEIDAKIQKNTVSEAVEDDADEI